MEFIVFFSIINCSIYRPENYSGKKVKQLPIKHQLIPRGMAPQTPVTESKYLLSLDDG